MLQIRITRIIVLYLSVKIWRLADDDLEINANKETSATPVRNDVISNEVTWSEREAGDKMAGDITCQLEPRDLWDKFHQLGTEMIITKSGRFLGYFYTFIYNYYCQLFNKRRGCSRENRYHEKITVSFSLDREQENKQWLKCNGTFPRSPTSTLWLIAFPHLRLL